MAVRHRDRVKTSAIGTEFLEIIGLVMEDRQQRLCLSCSTYDKRVQYSVRITLISNRRKSADAAKGRLRWLILMRCAARGRRLLRHRPEKSSPACPSRWASMIF